MKKNSIFIIRPYKYHETWVFDDSSVGLEREPFVMGIPEMIDTILMNKGLSENKFSVLFSSTGLPNCDLILERKEPEAGGTWYYSPMLDQKGWLCPALFLYYRKAPEKLFITFTE
jgi:hypothetical protein